MIGPRELQPFVPTCGDLGANFHVIRIEDEWKDGKVYYWPLSIILFDLECHLHWTIEAPIEVCVCAIDVKRGATLVSLQGRSIVHARSTISAASCPSDCTVDLRLGIARLEILS
jgi:hypothetical protein